uniref:Secreted protein n=1 Tax=Romanomermis culicivorax TaxID=13658 RepID=A0A915I8U6_ROMCU
MRRQRVCACLVWPQDHSATGSSSPPGNFRNRIISATELPPPPGHFRHQSPPPPVHACHRVTSATESFQPLA